MKKSLLILSLLFLGSVSINAQQPALSTKTNLSLNQAFTKPDLQNLIKYEVAPPDLQKLQQQDAERDRNGFFYRIGVTTTVNFLPQNSGSWEEMPNGDRIWRIRIHASGARALTIFFDQFKLFGNSSIRVLNSDGKFLTDKLTKQSNQETGVQNIPLIPSNDIILQLIEDKNALPAQLSINEIGYAYRGVRGNYKEYGDSDPCQNDINGSVGANWQDQKKGVARILVKEGSNQGWCSGSLVNNQANNCKPYFLTALHCGVNSSTSDFNQWRFYFNFEKPTYTSDNYSNSNDPNTIIGCVFKASSKDNGGATGSDYLLVQLGSTSNETTIVNRLKTTIGAYWNGWDSNNTASTSGAGIHHPSGDVKKISLYSTTLQTTGWNGNGLQSHWYVTWSNGVTEGGSSGSPLFNGNKVIIGTLTGGSSYCSAPNDPDMYGKMYYHWDKNTSAGHIDLKTLLDPNNTGNRVCIGSYDPCAVVDAPPVANFNVSQTTIPVNTTLTFNNTSTNNPTSNAWTITPSSGWTYAGGTNGSSVNPQVTFTQVGTYTVKLQASNSYGSDTKIQTNYITVTESTGGCDANTTECDEYIARVILNSIDNTTNCDNYIKYTTPTTSITAGQTYTIGIQPGVVGNGAGGYYQGDILAAWIDYNRNGQFEAGENVFYEELNANSSLTKNITIPTTLSAGTSTLRVRINYQEMDPCGTTQYGEVEDYKITLVAAGTNGIQGVDEIQDLTIYPNPATQFVHFSTSAEEVATNYQIRMVDLTGKVVKEAETAHLKQYKLNVGNLATGIYQLIIQQGDKISQRKLVIE